MKSVVVTARTGRELCGYLDCTVFTFADTGRPPEAVYFGAVAVRTPWGAADVFATAPPDAPDTGAREPAGGRGSPRLHHNFSGKGAVGSERTRNSPSGPNSAFGTTSRMFRIRRNASSGSVTCLLRRKQTARYRSDVPMPVPWNRRSCMGQGPHMTTTGLETDELSLALRRTKMSSGI